MFLLVVTLADIELEGKGWLALWLSRGRVPICLILCCMVTVGGIGLIEIKVFSTLPNVSLDSIIILVRSLQNLVNKSVITSVVFCFRGGQSSSTTLGSIFTVPSPFLIGSFFLFIFRGFLGAGGPPRSPP